MKLPLWEKDFLVQLADFVLEVLCTLKHYFMQCFLYNVGVMKVKNYDRPLYDVLFFTLFHTVISCYFMCVLIMTGSERYKVEVLLFIQQSLQGNKKGMSRNDISDAKLKHG